VSAASGVARIESEQSGSVTVTSERRADMWSPCQQTSLLQICLRIAITPAFAITELCRLVVGDTYDGDTGTSSSFREQL
jgi:hypothetical protein